MAPTPVFILSVPRAGSTLIQRILGSHESIATASEPWFLIPPLYALRETGIRAEYDHVTLTKGVSSFAAHYLTGGLAGYRRAVRELALSLYSQAAPGAAFFVDKSPRYSHVAAELLEVFPEAKFVLLWRNPLAVAASMIETFGGGRWNIKGPFAADLYRGLPVLAATYASNRERIHALRYEDLVDQPARELEQALRYVGVPDDPTLIARFSELPMPNPEFWDPTGTRAYTGISREPLSKWRSTMATPVRKRWCIRYLDALGPERLATMGYEYESLRGEVDALPSRYRHTLSDLVEHAKAPARNRLGLH
ncbi:MAG: sulfotransferase [Gaiellales bacterium]